MSEETQAIMKLVEELKKTNDIMIQILQEMKKP